MQIFITKYALTKGVEELEVEPSIGVNGYLSEVGKPLGFFGKLGNGCFINRSDAVKDAESQRVKKLASLRKQIERLERLKFE